MNLYYYTGVGTTEDLAYAKELGLFENQTAILVNEISVVGTAISYLNMKFFSTRVIDPNKFKTFWFSTRAFKPYIISSSENVQ